MIYGIGVHYLNSYKINKLTLKYKEKFINRFFSIREIQDSKTKFNQSLFFSKRFSAKISFHKAFSKNKSEKIFFKDIEIISDSLGKPTITIRGRTKRLIDTKQNNLNGKFNFFISLSDEPPNVLSFIIIFLAPL